MDGTAEDEEGVVVNVPELLDAAIACKRAVLLFAIWRDPKLVDRFLETDGALLGDLQTRVLPLVGPLFLANIGQRPDAFVALCATIIALWSDEQFCIPGQLEGSGAHSLT